MYKTGSINRHQCSIQTDFCVNVDIYSRVFLIERKNDVCNSITDVINDVTHGRENAVQFFK